MKINESYIARRRFLGSMVGGGLAALGTTAAVPLTFYAANLREEPLPDFLEIEKADYDLPPGKSKRMAYGPITALIIRTPEPESELRVFDATCTHLDCEVHYKEDEKRIFCACHEGYFDLSGQVTAGPPPKPLRQFYHRIKNDKLVIAREKENLEKAFRKSQT